MELKKRASNGVWYVHFKDADGNRARTSCGTTDADEAQLKAVEILREALVDASPRLDAKAASLLTLGDLLRNAWHNHWNDTKAATDLKPRVFKIIREIGHWSLPMVTHDRLRDYLNGLVVKTTGKPLSKATKNRYVSCISKAFALRRREDASLVIPAFPQWDESDNIKERYLSVDEEGQLLSWFEQNTAPADEQRLYLWNLCIVLIDTGMRSSEALVILSEKRLITSLSGVVRVHLPHGSTKTSKGRMVPLTKRAEAAARAMIASPLHGHQDTNNVGRQLKNVFDKLKIEGVTLHTFRHTCASRLLQRKVTLADGTIVKLREYDVMLWMGHTDIKTTRRYGHLAEDSLDEALALLEPKPVANVSAQPEADPALEAHPAAAGTDRGGFLRVIK